MRLKDISILNPTYSGTPLDGEVSFVPMDCLRYDEIENDTISYEAGKGKYTYFANGDLLIAKVTPCFENGNVAVANDLHQGFGFGSSEIFVLRMGKSCSNRYMFYLTQSSRFRNGACATMCGVGGLKRISPLFMRTFELDLPSLPEQRRIVAYLDEKTAEIDREVALLEKELDACLRLKRAVINRAVTRGLHPNVSLKDSGIDWIGMIPEHWEVKRLKDIGKIDNGLTYSPQDICNEDEGTLVLRAPNIQNGKLDLENEVFVKCEIPKFLMVKEGDVLICSRNGSLSLVGKSAIIDQSINATYGAFMLIFRANCDKRFAANLVSAIIPKYKGLYSTTTINQITKSILANMFVALPPHTEQITIASYLDAACAKIDAKAENIRKRMDAYKRLKRSLINDVVTGKRQLDD